MAEVAFAKQFLAALDSRPIKLSSDHVEDSRKHPAQSVYILPRMPKPFRRPSTSSTTPTTPSTVTVSLHALSSSSAPALNEALHDQPLTTCVHDLKAQVAHKTGYENSKIKLLYHKKPCPDSKTLKDLLPTEDAAPSTLEFSVMFMGQPTAKPAGAPSSSESGAEIASPSLEEAGKPSAAQVAEPQAPEGPPRSSLSGPAAAVTSEEVAASQAARDPPLSSLSGAAAAPSTQEVEMTPAGEPAEPTATESAAEQGIEGEEAMKADQFWSDLRGFLVQRLRNEHVGEEACAVFRAAWMGRGKLDVQMSDA